jgi:hypothetical protein
LKEIKRDIDREKERATDDVIDFLSSIVMNNNVFTFRDMTCKQKSDTTIGIPPVPPYASNLLCALCKDPIIKDYRFITN